MLVVATEGARGHELLVPGRGWCDRREKLARGIFGTSRGAVFCAASPTGEHPRPWTCEGTTLYPVCGVRCPGGLVAYRWHFSDTGDTGERSMTARRPCGPHAALLTIRGGRDHGRAGGAILLAAWGGAVNSPWAMDVSQHPLGAYQGAARTLRTQPPVRGCAGVPPHPLGLRGHTCGIPKPRESGDGCSQLSNSRNGDYSDCAGDANCTCR